MPRKVYLDTTVISYVTARPGRDIILMANQELTRQWWELRRQQFDLYVSDLVHSEASRGDTDAAAKRLESLAGIDILLATSSARELAGQLLSANGLPPNAADDALHLAIATLNQMDFLLTWNMRHLANAELQPGLAAACSAAGICMPVICTPAGLMGDST